MSFVLGVVSNVWASLLPEGSLEAECRRAVEAGYGYVELRQRALAACEEKVEGDGRPWPLPERLAELAAAFPELGFNLAVEAPFLTSPLAVDDPYLLRCARAAKALGGTPPALRLVDVSPVSGLLADEATLYTLAASVARLAEVLWKDGVLLVLENSKQPLAPLREVIRRAVAALPAGVPAPQLCWDPHNQIVQTLAAEDPAATARATPVEEFFEFHFKQGRDGVLQPDVAEGELDWRAILSAFHENGYQGPALYEIPPSPDIWERLDRSTAYIRGLIAEVER